RRALSTSTRVVCCPRSLCCPPRAADRHDKAARAEGNRARAALSRAWVSPHGPRSETGFAGGREMLVKVADESFTHVGNSGVVPPVHPLVRVFLQVVEFALGAVVDDLPGRGFHPETGVAFGLGQSV